MGKIELVIEEENPVWSVVRSLDPAREILSYDAVYYKTKMVGYKKEKKIYERCFRKKSLVDRKGYFNTGLIERLESGLLNMGMRVSVNRIKYDILSATPVLNGIKFRDDQLEALDIMVAANRGVWQAPTGSGKTILMCGLISCYYDSRVLVIVHTRDLFEQTIKELSRWWDCIGKIGCGLYDEQDITVAMVQTLYKKNFNACFGESWGLLIVDESHHANKDNGMYYSVLSRIYAPMRFGLTATLPEDDGGKMVMEGLIGPVLGKTSYKELECESVLAKPIIKLKYVPESNNQKALKGKYVDVYNEGVVYNAVRNKMVVDAAFEYIDMGLTVLVMVERIEHGLELLALCNDRRRNTFVFLHGNTSAQIRKEEKEAFADKARKGVIVTRIWGEGTNIKTVGAVVNAVGGASEIATLQRFGRGLRATDGKEGVFLVDFFDPNHLWFLRHSGKRVCMYFEQGWL